MSANAAEVLTLIHAVNAIRDRDFDISRIRLSIYGDSIITLNWAKKHFEQRSKPFKKKSKATGEFREAVGLLKLALLGFENIHTHSGYSFEKTP